jgi:hypothetical protein
VYKFVYLEDGLDCPKYVGTNVNIILLYILYYIAYWLTGSNEQSPSWETNRFPASQEIPPFYGTQSFITAFTSACQLPLSWAHTNVSIQVWDTNLYFITWYVFMVRSCSHLTQCLSYNTTPCWLSAIAYPYWRPFLHPQPEDAACMVTGAHLSWLSCILWWIYYNKWFRRCIVSMYNKCYCFLSSSYVSFLRSSGNVTYHASHLPL